MRYFLLLVTCAFIVSCTCSRNTKNTVADQETHKAIDSVEVRSVAATGGGQSDEHVTYTDSNGYFEASYNVSGVAKCPVLKVTLSNPNYETKRVASPNMGDTLFMKRLN